MNEAGPGRLEACLRAARARGRKCLVPYVTGGLADWEAAVEAAAAAGADAVEIGIPFSDPVIDGPVIQEAGDRALAAGATPAGIVAAAAGLDVGLPLVIMTYYNIAHRMGITRFASSLASAGVAGAILADLPLEEAGPWATAADEAGVETVLLAAPTASAERLEAICARARGFVYAVGLLGVTGERATLAASAVVIARRLKDVTDVPVLVGVGVSTPAQAAEAATVADGVVVGSAVVRRLLEGGGAEGVGDFVASVRRALDGAAT
ncbi:MAG: tryptophan synthase subunit alpha [bacterium]|nr:tryptophan synthase subunit alpha [bacterium]MDE0667428.1 tryptophan synthase subunit alpha [bacterium]MXZ31039.1 tryptophan synthase subunit alpha [Acidimicrobiia bacterium]MYB25407.1 tryptophan synthase subunit alpha [Acidimicrobiia bacterium]